MNCVVAELSGSHNSMPERSDHSIDIRRELKMVHRKDKPSWSRGTSFLIWQENELADWCWLFC